MNYSLNYVSKERAKLNKKELSEDAFKELYRSYMRAHRDMIRHVDDFHKHAVATE